MLSLSEENYLKVIYKIEHEEKQRVTTTTISEWSGTKASSVTDMLKKLAQKELVHYIKYQDVTLTDQGCRRALLIVRKHRLWETFLVEKLQFRWDEVHEIAEQLEHIQSDSLISRLDDFLGNPAADPHGDPIPSASGQLRTSPAAVTLNQVAVGAKGVVNGVRDTSTTFLRYLTRLGIQIGTPFALTDRMPFDQSVELLVGGRAMTLSREAAENIYALPESGPETAPPHS